MEHKYRKHHEHFFYAILFCAIIYLIIYLKIYGFRSNAGFVYVYTLFIAIFMLSRILGSLFYQSPWKRFKEEHKKIHDSGYFPSVSFIIPCKNEEKSIFHTMVKCMESNYPTNKKELIVINDGSTDGSLFEMQRAKKYIEAHSFGKVKIINFRKNLGKREAMAAGITRAFGEIIISVDSDSYPEKDSLTKLVIPFIDPKVGASTGHTDPSNADKNVLTKIQAAYYFVSFRALKAAESLFDLVFCCSGCFSAYRKSYVLPVLSEWRNEYFLGKKISFGDDRSLTKLMIREGYQTVYVDEAQAYTFVPETLSKFLKQQTRWKKSWFINTLNLIPIMLKRDIFVNLSYFIPLFIITLLNPIVVFKAMVFNPITGVSPLSYIMGVMLVSLMFYTHYRIYSEDKHGKYIILYSVLSMTILPYILIYALLTIRNTGWITR